jgi:5-methylcytosine-specific restriction endonuclease McrA
MFFIIPKKQCRKCGAEKRVDEFQKDRRLKSGYSNLCKACSNQKSRQWNFNNKTKVLKSVKEWFQVNKEKRRKYYREYVRQYRKIHPQKSDPRASRAWKRKHPEKVSQYNSNRRARNNGLSGKIFAEQWKEIVEKYGKKCLRCGRGDVILTIDHILPLSGGGKHEISNIQPLCKSCNSKKGKKHIDYR